MTIRLFHIACRAGLVPALFAALVLPAAAGPHPRDRKDVAHVPAKLVSEKLIEPTIELSPSPSTVRLTTWVAAARDNGNLPYAVIDKQTASLFLFDAKGKPLGQTPVLIGVGVGDDSSPGVGAKSLSEIGPAERTTPAGRYVAKFGRAFGRQRVLWVDYVNSVALHAVINTKKKEQRLVRLASPAPDDNRITFGCINVGTSFYAKTLRPLFQKRGGVVYILPDTRSLDDVFPRLRMLPYLTAASG
ncbi:hypothetical protein ASG67_00100 [Sphingomonas sp. Leaf339]|uniref:hypothetical protein n=1 Tax=Sphingomonas sp. Leaf339 TaxID=1736343 RepID=UPI0006F1F4E8|nr:hypothetical protein [Sphingomonas sp. Leaf339]KQU62486.1 hypothetical protein ASG67_00100 [Sphingomonas sp. Leaf339]